MVISDDNYFPILIDNIEVPTKTDVFWTFNLEHKDFMLSPLYMFEEITVPVFVMDIMGYTLEVPTNWNLLCYSEETSQLDILEISEISRGIFTSVVFDHKKNSIIPGQPTFLDFHDNQKFQTVSLNKNVMICHAVGPDYWICIAPSDNYNKYLKNAVIGDLI